MAAPPRGLAAEHRAYTLPQGDACSAAPFLSFETLNRVKAIFANSLHHLHDARSNLRVIAMASRKVSS